MFGGMKLLGVNVRVRSWNSNHFSWDVDMIYSGWLDVDSCIKGMIRGLMIVGFVMICIEEDPSIIWEIKYWDGYQGWIKPI